MLHAASASRGAGLMNELSGVAKRAAQLLFLLDTTTAAAIAIDAELPRLEIDADGESAIIGFAIVRRAPSGCNTAPRGHWPTLSVKGGRSAAGACIGLSGNHAISMVTRPVSSSPEVRGSTNGIKAYHNLPFVSLCSGVGVRRSRSVPRGAVG